MPDPHLLVTQRVTIKVVYHLPDRPVLLGIFCVQVDDDAGMTHTDAFLQYWEKHIQAKIHSVVFGRSPLSRTNVRHGKYIN